MKVKHWFEFALYKKKKRKWFEIGIESGGFDFRLTSFLLKTPNQSPSLCVSQLGFYDFLRSDP